MTDALKLEARLMRESGESIKVIAATLDVPVGTLHGWVKDIELPEDVKKALRRRGGLLTGQRRRQEKQQRLQESPPSPKVKGKPGYNPKGMGEKTMAQILATFLAADMTVLIPFGDNQRYDLVVDEDGQFIRVQCKTARFQGDCFIFSTCSNNWNTKKKKSYKGQADIFAVYLVEKHHVYIFNVNNCPNNTCNVRLIPCGRTKLIRMAEAHLFTPGTSLLDYP